MKVSHRVSACSVLYTGVRRPSSICRRGQRCQVRHKPHAYLYPSAEHTYVLTVAKGRVYLFIFKKTWFSHCMRIKMDKKCWSVGTHTSPRGRQAVRGAGSCGDKEMRGRRKYAHYLCLLLPEGTFSLASCPRAIEQQTRPAGGTPTLVRFLCRVRNPDGHGSGQHVTAGLAGGTPEGHGPDQAIRGGGGV